MKKLLSCILAIATVFSASAFAAPAAESVETADEFTSADAQDGVLNAESGALLTDETVDYNAPLYGVKLVSEDFESWTDSDWFDYTRNSQNQLIKNGIWWSIENGAIKGIPTDASGVEALNRTGKVLKINVPGDNQWSSIKMDFRDKSIDIPANYTCFADLYIETEALAEGLNNPPRPYARFKVGNNTSSYAKTMSYDKTVKPVGEWFTQKATLTTPASVTKDGVATDCTNFIILQRVFDTSAVSVKGTAYMDNVAIYYKPAASADYTSVEFSYPVITLRTDGGFEESAAAALKADPKKCISSAVSSVEFSGNDMIITLDEDNARTVDSIKIPALVNAAKDATYPEQTISLPDYYSAIYGLKNYYWNAAWKSTKDTNATSFAVNEFMTDSDGLEYLHLEKTGYTQSLRINRTSGKPYNGSYTYTYFQKTRVTNTNDNKLLKIDWENLSYNTIKKTTLKDGEWTENVFADYTVDDTKLTNLSGSNPYLYIGTKDANKVTTVDIAYAGLYYKPVKAAADPEVVSNGSKVTLTYSEGIDETQAAALEVYYTKYFNGNVSALAVNGNDVAVTLADGVESVTISALVNADGTATYPETEIEAQKDIAPVTVNEKELRLTSENSGIRFKAYVLHENLEKLDEYGYIVALEQTLIANGKALTDLTFDLDKNTVKYVSEAAYVKDRETNYIFDNNYDVNGDTANLFTGVLTGIPKGKYHLTLVARPYAKSKDTYYYGEPISGNVQELASGIKNNTELYNSLSTEKKAIIDEFAANAAQ